MPRIDPVSIEAAPAASKPVLEQIKAQFGKLPNVFATLAHSPATLKALMGIFGALEEGDLAGKAHEAIALRVSQIHGCEYCLAAHSAKAQMAGATAEEIIGFRQGQSHDPKIQALLVLAEKIVDGRGQLSDEDIQPAKGAGVTEAQLLEAVAIVACSTFTNYVNTLVQTEVDFPPAPDLD